MSKLYDQLRVDILNAMRARDTEKATSLRTMDGAIQRISIDENRAIDDALVLSSLRKAVKDLQGANEQFSKGGRDDLVEKNMKEIALLEAYLPKQLDLVQTETIVNEAIKASGASSKREMGKVMGLLKARPDAALIDFGIASKLIQSRLS